MVLRQFASLFLQDKPFQYQRLTPRSREIRLVEVLPTRNLLDGSLQCKIKHFSFDRPDIPKYEAISYVWGDPRPCKAITINGRQLLLPENGEAALRRMALQDRSRVLWIDSVCVDQSHLDERAQQVSMMGLIFHNATTVLAYLGEADQYTTSALRTISLLVQEMEEDLGIEDDLMNIEARLEHPSYHRPLRTSIDEEGTKALDMFYANPWFTRLWIVQEVAVAASSQVIIGSYQTNMNDVLRVAFWLMMWHTNFTIFTFRLAVHPLERPAYTWIIRRGYTDRRSISISTLLMTGRPFESTDQRDKVYAMLHLLEKSQRHKSIEPDYRKPVPHLFRDAARQDLITTDNPFSTIALVSHRWNDDLEPRRDGFRTWVPRLDRKLEHGHDPGYLVMPRNVEVHCLGSIPKYELMVRVGPDPDMLSLHGFTLSAVTYLIGDQRRISSMEEVEQMLKRYDVSLNAFARTLISDRSYSEQTFTSHDLESFFIWFNYRKAGHAIPPISKVTAETESDDVRACHYEFASQTASYNRTLAILDNGAIALIPMRCSIGDRIIITHGMIFPFVLRPWKDEYVMMGQCYVDGWMPWQSRYEEMNRRLFEEGNEVFNIR